MLKNKKYIKLILSTCLSSALIIIWTYAYTQLPYLQKWDQISEAYIQTLSKMVNTSDELKKSLSENRFLPYLKKAGYDNSYAFNLYL